MKGTAELQTSLFNKHLLQYTKHYYMYTFTREKSGHLRIADKFYGPEVSAIEKLLRIIILTKLHNGLVL